MRPRHPHRSAPGNRDRRRRRHRRDGWWSGSGGGTCSRSTRGQGAEPSAGGRPRCGRRERVPPWPRAHTARGALPSARLVPYSGADPKGSCSHGMQEHTALGSTRGAPAGPAEGRLYGQAPHHPPRPVLSCATRRERDRSGSPTAAGAQRAGAGEPPCSQPRAQRGPQKSRGAPSGNSTPPPRSHQLPRPSKTSADRLPARLPRDLGAKLGTFTGTTPDRKRRDPRRRRLRIRPPGWIRRQSYTRPTPGRWPVPPGRWRRPSGRRQNDPPKRLCELERADRRQ